MKNLALVFLALSLNLHAEEECSLANVSTAVEDLAEQNCDVVDKMSSCAERAVDPDAVRKNITKLFDRTETDKDKIVKNWATYKPTSYSQLFHFDKGLENTKDYAPTPLLDWMTNNGTTDLKKDDLKASLIDQYVEYAKKHDCTPVIRNRSLVVSYPSNLKTKTKAELDLVVNAPGYAKEKDAFFKTLNAKALGGGTYCDYTAKINMGPWQKVAELYPPCTGNLTGLFKDNVWATSSIDDNSSPEATDEVTRCIKDRVAKGAKIHHISIVSSASALNNTGEAAKQFCKKGFKGLSKARAESTRDKILPTIFESTDADYLSKVKLNYNGSNGDGTSGPCPYVLKDGKEVLKSEYATTVGKKALDDDKYVRVHVTFESHSKSFQKEQTEFIPYYYCRNIDFACRPIAE